MAFRYDGSSPFGNSSAQGNASAFQDPSVQRVVGGTSVQRPVAGASLDEFNPFAASAQPTVTARGGAQPTGGVVGGQASGQSEPATLQPQEAPPAYTPSAAQRVSTDELERRARELEEKEAQLRAREEALRNAAQAGGPSKNWPPLPSWLPVGPCFYQDIQVEIPSHFQAIVRRGYYLWIAHTGVLFLNFIAAIFYFSASASQDSSNAGTTLGCSILFIVMFTPCSYVCWFRPLYKAFRSDASLQFFAFFVIFFAQFIVSVVNAIGFIGYGAIGWINTLSIIGSSPGTGLFMMICAAGFTALAAMDFLFMVTVHRLYRTTGASFEQAKSELATSVLSNPGVQSGIVQAATSGIGAPAAGARRF